MGEAKRRGSKEKRIAQTRRRSARTAFQSIDWTIMLHRSNRPDRFLPNFTVIVTIFCAAITAIMGFCLMLIDASEVRTLLPDNTMIEMIERIRNVAVSPFITAAIFAGWAVWYWIVRGIPNIPLDKQVLGTSLYTSFTIVGGWLLLAELDAPLSVVLLYLLVGTLLIINLTYSFGALGNRFGLHRLRL